MLTLMTTIALSSFGENFLPNSDVPLRGMSGDLLVTETPTPLDLLSILTTIDHYVMTICNITAYIVFFCAWFSTVLPPALDKDDKADTKFEKFRTTWFYRIFRRLVCIAGGNFGWARNLTSPLGVKLIHGLLLGLKSRDALNSLKAATEEAIAKKLEKEEEDEKSKPESDTDEESKD